MTETLERQGIVRGKTDCEQCGGEGEFTSWVKYAGETEHTKQTLACGYCNGSWVLMASSRSPK